MYKAIIGSKKIQAYALLLLATAIWGGNLVVGKAATAYFPPLTLAVLTLSGFSVAESPDLTVLAEWNAEVIFILLYIGIAAAIVSFLAWNVAIDRVGASMAGIFYNLIPLFSIVFSIFFLGESVFDLNAAWQGDYLPPDVLKKLVLKGLMTFITMMQSLQERYVIRQWWLFCPS